MSVAKNARPEGPRNEEEKELDFANYFHSYGFLFHQKDMLQDRGRMDAYRTAILGNPDSFKDKVVLDVGTGSGVLAIWAAQAGARRVYAIEATTMAANARQLAAANGMQDVVHVLEGYMEQIEIPEQIDIIISEWMGYFLLRESMLDPVLGARDKYLKAGGALYPSQSQLMLAPLCSQLYSQRLAEYEEEIYSWARFGEYMRETNKIDIGALDPVWEREQFEYLMNTAHWCQLHADELIGDAASILELDVHTVTIEEVSTIRSPFSARIHVAAELNAFGGWFDCFFKGSGAAPAAHVVELTTAPPSETHWGQQVFMVHPAEQVESGDLVEGSVAITRQQQNHRLLHMQVTFKITRLDGSSTAERTINYKID
mmetsp:Transcript_2621/g.5897  ORF Transcript_2621/g.5897 Transcript_2621/m.5897 type:complete len:371 (-) Transcript_2621:610-1722(-)